MSPERTYETPRLVAWRSATDLPLTVLAIGSLPILLLELQRSQLTSADHTMIDVVYVAVLVAFAIDYIVELVVASNRARFVRGEWTSLAIVVAQGLALAPSLAGFGALRALRGARAIGAIARVFAIGGLASREGRKVGRAGCSAHDDRLGSLGLDLAGVAHADTI